MRRRFLHERGIGITADWRGLSWWCSVFLTHASILKSHHVTTASHSLLLSNAVSFGCASSFFLFHQQLETNKTKLKVRKLFLHSATKSEDKPPKEIQKRKKKNSATTFVLCNSNASLLRPYFSHAWMGSRWFSHESRWLSGLKGNVTNLLAPPFTPTPPPRDSGPHDSPPWTSVFYLLKC